MIKKKKISICFWNYERFRENISSIKNIITPLLSMQMLKFSATFMI